MVNPENYYRRRPTIEPPWADPYQHRGVARAAKFLSETELTCFSLTFIVAKLSSKLKTPYEIVKLRGNLLFTASRNS